MRVPPVVPVALVLVPELPEVSVVLRDQVASEPKEWPELPEGDSAVTLSKPPWLFVFLLARPVDCHCWSRLLLRSFLLLRR